MLINIQSRFYRRFLSPVDITMNSIFFKSGHQTIAGVAKVSLREPEVAREPVLMIGCRLGITFVVAFRIVSRRWSSVMYSISYFLIVSSFT